MVEEKDPIVKYVAFAGDEVHEVGVTFLSHYKGWDADDYFLVYDRLPLSLTSAEMMKMLHANINIEALNRLDDKKICWETGFKLLAEGCIAGVYYRYVQPSNGEPVTDWI